MPLHWSAHDDTLHINLRYNANVYGDKYDMWYILLYTLAIQCIFSVLNVQPEICSSTSVEITLPSGLIPSILSQETPCGTYKAPWLIKAPPGQNIRITLIDYSVVPLDSRVQAPSAAVCVAYASIREKGVRAPFTLCGGREFEQEVYRSQSNAVEIIVQGAQQKYQRYFVIQYSCMYSSSQADHAVNLKAIQI